MNCTEFEKLASALLEGESHPEAHAHLASCPHCRLLINELGAIEQAARTLPLQEPSPRLWARLEAVATAEGLWTQPRWQQWPAPLASVFPLRPALAGVLGLIFLLAVGLVSSPPAEKPLSAAAAFEVARGELVQEAGYANRYEVHLQTVEDQMLAPEGEAVMDAGLRDLTARPLSDVDRCIAQTQQRLNDHPDDTLARDELRRLYQQKVTVLQAMADPVWMEVGR